MQSDPTRPTNWFDQGGRAYAAFRPGYPPALSRFLAEIAPDRRRAVDVGCGNGQLTRQLADHFSSVVGVDPSVDQITRTVPHERIEYLCAPAEVLPLPDSSVSLITAAQAVHWFDLPAFYAEARRIAVDGAVIALVSYGVLHLAEADLQDRFSRFYWDEIAPYWPPERKLVDTGYADISLPFSEREGPVMAIDRTMVLDDFLGYVSTWSAVRRLKEAGRSDILENFARDISVIWGDPTIAHALSWPINMRLGAI